MRLNVGWDLNADWSVATTYLGSRGIDNHLRQTSSATGVSYFLSDHLGSTSELTDANGNLVEESSYDSFGNSGGSARTRYGYTGRERDPDTGMQYYRARFYDPQLGRFIAEDPIRFRGGDVDWYVYVKNRPLSFRDPSGLDWEWAVAGGSTLTGAAGTGALGVTAAAAAPVAAVVVVGGLAIYGAWQLGEAIADAPWNPFTHPRDLPAYPRAVPKCDAPPTAIPIPPPPPPPPGDKCTDAYEACLGWALLGSNPTEQRIRRRLCRDAYDICKSRPGGVPVRFPDQTVVK